MKTSAKPSHIGRKISKIRELRGIKQEALAIAIGVSQQTISNIENSDEVEEEVLGKIAKALEVTVEGIKNFTEEAVFNNINNFHDNAIQNNFNPIEKVVELYERLLAAEKEKFEYLEKLFKDKL
jgi:transcriptional regulator with XRE-family HTH domain